MTRRAKAAHLRLLEQPLPRTTHHRRYGEEAGQGRRYGETLPQSLVDEYKRLKASGMGYTDILQTLGIGSHTMQRLVRLVGAKK